MTNKDIREAFNDFNGSLKNVGNSLQRLSDNDQILDQKLFQINSLFTFYLKYRGKEEEELFGKFVKEEIEKNKVEPSKETNKK